jgi:NADPH:quinone reductase-like Zn-dependent oxidoreductase
MAKVFGAEVTGVASTAQLDLLRSIGAGQVLDYTREDVIDGTATGTSSRELIEAGKVTPLIDRTYR